MPTGVEASWRGGRSFGRLRMTGRCHADRRGGILEREADPSTGSGCRGTVMPTVAEASRRGSQILRQTQDDRALSCRPEGRHLGEGSRSFDRLRMTWHCHADRSGGISERGQILRQAQDDMALSCRLERRHLGEGSRSFGRLRMTWHCHADRSGGISEREPDPSTGSG